jgi:hypothetical protein
MVGAVAMGGHSKWMASQSVSCCGSVHSTRWRFPAGWLITPLRGALVPSKRRVGAPAPVFDLWPFVARALMVDSADFGKCAERETLTVAWSLETLSHSIAVERIPGRNTVRRGHPRLRSNHRRGEALRGLCSDHGVVLLLHRCCVCASVGEVRLELVG